MLVALADVHEQLELSSSSAIMYSSNPMHAARGAQRPVSAADTCTGEEEGCRRRGRLSALHETFEQNLEYFEQLGEGHIAAQAPASSTIASAVLRRGKKVSLARSAVLQGGAEGQRRVMST